MKKGEFVALVKENGKFKTNVEAENAIDAVFKGVTEGLKSNDEIAITGFGIFHTAEQKGKEGTIPGSTKKYKTETKMVAKFKPSKTLKDLLATK